MSIQITDRVYKKNPYQISSYEDLISINPEFRRDGYTISSWNTSSDGSGLCIGLDYTFNISSDNTLYAMWKKYGILRMVDVNGINHDFNVEDIEQPMRYSHPNPNPTAKYYPFIADTIISNCLCLLYVNDLEGNILSIGQTAFSYCENLISVEFPNVEYIKDEQSGGSFLHCEGLINIKISDKNDNFNLLDESNNVKKSGIVLINNTKKQVVWGSMKKSQYVVIPDDVSSIGEASFYKCRNLKKVNCNNVKILGQSSFNYCDSLSDIICDNVISVGNYAFRDTKLISHLYLPNVTDIGYSVFEYVSNRALIECPNVSSIGYDFHRGGDVSVIISSYDGVCNIQETTFHKTSYYDHKIYVKDNQYKNYITSDYWINISDEISSITQPVVSFLSGTTYDTLVKTEKLNYAMSAVPPEITREGYELTGWLGNYNDVTEDISCFAQWKETVEYGNIHYFENDPNPYLVASNGGNIVDSEGNKLIIGE